MKKYMKLLPVILYPYAYILWIVVYMLGYNLAENLDDSGSMSETFLVVLLAIAALYQILALVMAIYGAVWTAKNDLTARETAKMNMTVKCVQIPAYIFHFIVGVFSLALSVWGIGFLLFVIVVDLLTIILSGIFAVGCVWKAKKQGVITQGVAILSMIGSFVYCIDVGIAIWLYIRAKKLERVNERESV